MAYLKAIDVDIGCILSENGTVNFALLIRFKRKLHGSSKQLLFSNKSVSFYLQKPLIWLFIGWVFNLQPVLLSW